MSGTLRPDALPRPPDFGYLGDMQVPTPDLTPPDPTTPEQAASFIKQNYEQPATIPDALRVRYGAGDPATVKALLLTANGQDGGLVGVPATYAASVLQSFGYPTTMDAWDGPTWQQAIASHAADPNPLTLPRGY